MTIPYTAIGDNELGKKLGHLIQCPHCGKRHRVKRAKSRSLLADGTWGPLEDKGLMQFFTCKGKTYVCGINGRRWK